MKLRLPRMLFRALVACFAPVALTLASVASAAYMHSSPTIQEYADIAEGRGVYRFGTMTSAIIYRNGEADYTLTITPDFSSVADMGCYTLVNNGSFQLTVEHNGIMLDATFTGRYVGEYAQQYSGVGIRGNTTFVFGGNNPYVSMNEDYKVERLSRLATDSSSAVYNTDPNVLTNLSGTTIYRVGAGNSGWYDTEGNINWNVAAWGAGLTAGITQLAGSYDAGNGVYNVEYSASNYATCTPDNALPSNGQPGDSGSPVFIFNEAEGRFEFVGPLQGASDTFWISRYNPTATTEAIEYCTVNCATTVDFQEAAAENTTYYISGAKVGENDELIQDGEAATYLRKGSISLAGQEVASFNGVALEEFSQGTWKMLDADSLTWYTYSDEDYINARPNVAQGADAFGTEDLFYTSNLHFTANAAGAATTAHRRIELTEDVDLGIGHVQFSLGEGTTAATYELGMSSSDYFLSSAGFVVDEGVTLNNYFTYEKGRELRRVGEGTMNMLGTGNSDVLLNIGGGGLTYLNRTNGYAAYSALVNNKAVLRLADVGQVYNNVTLGANGGVLDFHGNDYRWTSGGARALASDGKVYFGLTVYEGQNRVENSYVVNEAAGTSSTLTIERTDNFEFAGAFRDGSSYLGAEGQVGDSRYTMMPAELIGYYQQFAASQRQESDSTLRVIYAGGATMEMTGVYTLLTGNSGLEVTNGKVSLHGTNTIHAIGSESGTSLNRWQNAQDWHYAMAEMEVKVGQGACFELGDHALLLGNVQVASGGSLVMKQAVNERYEYVEGWYRAEDCYALADYYGLKGDVSLAAGASMELRFDEGVATHLGYGGKITGEGSLRVDVGSGSVTLSGNNTFSGEKTVASGNLRLESGAEGNTATHRWLVQEQGSLALEAVSDNATLESLVDARSTGVLALTQDFAQQVSLSGLIVGAAEGERVHYGAQDASLQAVGNQWTLGGGGGTLVVDFLLEGSNKLVLGNEYGTGMVVLNNAGNSFSGGIELAGKVTLGYISAGALGNNVLSIGYGSILAAMEGATFAADKVDAASQGALAIADGAQAVDFRQHSGLSLGAVDETTLTGGLTVAEGATYRLGGAGTLTLACTLSGNHGILVDGQGSTGSRVIFATASSDTGAVVVQGYDASRAASGEVTLSLATDNALASASSVTLRQDAGLDLNGTNQRFNNLSMDTSSLIFDDKGGNTLTLNYEEDASLSARVQAAGTEVVKVGGGTLLLSGENLWKGLTINEGAVQVADSLALGYLETGSQGIAVTVNNGGSLLFTKDESFLNTLNIAGFGTDGASWALVTTGHLNNAQGALNVTADAAISGRFSFKQLTLKNNSLTVAGSGSSLSASSISSGTLRMSEGATLNLEGYKGGVGVALVLDNATALVADGYFDGTLTVGVGGATLNYDWSKEKKSYSLTGLVSGEAAEGTLRLVGYGQTYKLSGGVALAGGLDVWNGVKVSVMKDATIGFLTNSDGSGDPSSLTVDAVCLEINGSGSNYQRGSIELTNGGRLQLFGLADGSSMGSLGTLKMGSDGVLTLASLAGYTGSQAMMNIAAVEGTRQLQIDAASLAALADGSTYHLLSSASELSGWTLLNSSVAGTRQNFELIAGGESGAYTLDLKVTGVAAHATWQGTGTLVAGQVNDNISSTAGDNTFMAMDSLTLTSEATANDTLTLGGSIQASSVHYTGAGTLTLAQENGGSFAGGVNLVLDGTGTLALGDAATISGEIELKQGRLSASSSSLNGTKGVRVTGDAEFELTSASHVTADINIARDASLTLSFKSDSMADQWGGNLDDNLSGEGALRVNIGAENELHLNGDHTAHTGSIALLSGTLQLGLRENGTLSSSILGATSMSVASGTTLALSSSATTVAADIDWAGGATLHVKDGVGSGVAYTFSGQQRLGGALTITSAGGHTVQLSGDITGSGSLNFASGGEGTPGFILSGNNSYTGGTTINRSGLTVYAANANALGTGTIRLQNGTLAWRGIGLGWNGELAAASIELSGSASMNSQSYNVTYSGAVSGNSGSFTKTGTGTLTLTNFTYTGATHVQEGTLALGIGKSSWYTGFSGDENATLRINGTSPYGTYLMGAMSGGMSVELSGDFGYVAANTHTGGTTLLSGSLEIGNVAALKSGALHAAAGTTVSVVMQNTYMAGDSVVDALSFGEGASVLVGADNAAGSLSFGSLSGTGTFLLDVFSADSYDRLSGTLTPGSLLDVNLKASELGSYLLVAGDNAGYDVNTIAVTGKDEANFSYIWTASEAGLTLSIFDVASGSSNIWMGGASGTWDASSDSWANGSFDSQKKTLVCAQENTSILVGAAVSTTSLETEVAEGVTLRFSKEGSGSISASSLQKDGAGTLCFEAGSANTFSSVVVNEGVLSVADASALGTVNISGNGTFELTGGSIRADLNAGAMAVTNIRLEGGALTLYSTAYWGTTISGRTIEIVGEGSSLALEKWANLNASAITLRDGGTLCTGENGLGNDGGSIAVLGSGTIKAGNQGAGDIAAAVSGSGTLTIARWNGSSQANINGVMADAEGGALSLVLDHNNVHLNAENTHSGGTTLVSGSVTTSKESSLGTGALIVNGGTLNLGGKLSTGSLSGTDGTIATGEYELHVNQTEDGAYAGDISGSGTLTKSGGAALELSGSNSIGSINLQEGRLVAASDAALGEATIAVASGASLYVTNGATVSNTLTGGSYIVGAEAEQQGAFSGAAAASLLSSGFTKEGAGLVTVFNGTGQTPAGAMTVNAGTLAYDAGRSSVLGAVSGSGTFALVGGAVNANNINVGKLEISQALLAYNSTFDGKALEVSGQGAELRMGHWASVNNSTLLLKDGGQLSMSSSGFNNSTVTVEGSGIIAVGETASPDENPLLNVESTVSGNGTLHLVDYGSLVYTVNFNKVIADGAEGALALESSLSDLHLKAANTYSGGTTISGGHLVAEAVGALGSGSVAVNGGKLSLSLGDTEQLFYIGSLSGTGGSVDIGKNTLVINQSQDGCFLGSITGTGGLIKRGESMLELGGSASSADLQIDSGTVRLASSEVFANGSMTESVVTLNGGVFDINGQTTGSGADSFMFDVFSGYLAFRGETDMLVKDSSGRADSGLGFNTEHAYTGISHRGTGRAEIAANIVSGGSGAAGEQIRIAVQSTGDLEISGNIGADQSVASHHQFGIYKSGTGTMILSGDNGYTGGTELAEGTLVAASDTALGQGALTVASGATLEIAAGRHLTLDGAISFGVDSTLKLGSLDAGQAALSTTGGWTLGGSMNLNIGVELEAGVEYKVLSGLSSATGITITGQEGYRYTCTTVLRDGTYYVTASDYEAAQLTWVNNSSDAVWGSGEMLWTTETQPDPGSAQGTVGSASKDTVIFAAGGSKDVTVAEAGVVVEAVQVTAGQDYRFEGGSLKANEVSVSEGASMSHGAVYTVSQKDTTADATISQVTMSSDAAAGAGAIHGADEGSLAELDNAVIEIAAGGKSLSLQDVLLAETSIIAGLDAAASLELANVTLALGDANTLAVPETTFLSGGSLLTTGGGESFALEEGTKVCSLFSSALSSVFVSGSSLTLDLSALTGEMLADVEFADYVAISFGDGVDNAVAFEATALSIKARYDGREVEVCYMTAPANQRISRVAAQVDTLYISTSLFRESGGDTPAIPEPGTATLSLLALSMLAARRRRK